MAHRDVGRPYGGETRCVARIARHYGTFRRRCRGNVEHRGDVKLDQRSFSLLACPLASKARGMRPDEIERPVEPAARAPETTRGLSETIARLLLTRSPLGYVVRRVAGIRASVHAKLLGAFLLIALLLIAMGAMSLRAITSVSRNSQLLEQAHERVEASRQIEHTVAVQMNFIRNALVLRDEATIGSVLRESHRFTKTLALLEEAAPPGEGETIRRIRTAQDRVVTKVQDIAKLIGEGKSDDAMALHLNEGYPLYREIAALVTRVVQTEEAGMDGLRQRVAAANRQALLLMGGFAAASIFLALLLGFVISWSFILPVREAEGFLGRIAKGDFGATIDVPNRDEFGALASRMNQMSRELHELYEDLRRAAHQLQTLNVELERASKAKSDFLASMSHELRTPMNAILGFTEMVLDDVYGDVPPAIREPVSDIHACGKQLLRLINDVLDLSKIEAGRMELALGDYSVEDVVNTVKSSLRSLAMEKGLDFVTTVRPDTPPGFGDSKRITQCLVNLAGNALKFTQEGRVEIRVELEGETLLFAVSDTGIGIPPHQREHIFEEFQQVDPTVTQELGGTGLGLSITRKFVELHGGRIWVESEPEKGSTFFFSIPVRVERGATG
jgi:signal transduction histidine kinase